MQGRASAPRVLVMTPTRELAGQIAREFESICGALTVLCVYGGVPYDNQCKQPLYFKLIRRRCPKKRC